MQKQEQTLFKRSVAGVWQGFDHLTKLESSKVEVVLQWGLLNFK